ncbi:MAG: 4-hydroxyacetophenone monooxygenase [Gammaproteobacteria bacterium]|nr:MAG: 4-hydroxyacetophenone monooxygenase [Gammaproteobacteria bacterium]
MNNIHALKTGPNQQFPIAIIGSGFAGVGMGIELRKAGIDSFTIFEREGDVGGTWRDNTYPGCACDVPSYVYSYSFEPNSKWSSIFGKSSEIQTYIKGCVKKYQLEPYFRFNEGIKSAVFDESLGLWELTTSKNKKFTARAVISAVGGLTDPANPDINGLEQFKGEMFHTARWNHDYDLKGKKVAIIGTGCSSIQVIPEIVDDVEHLDVYQRTPGWIMPKIDLEVSEKTQKFFSRFPLIQRLIRGVLYWGSEALAPPLILDSPFLSKIFEGAARRNIKRGIRDPELRKKLTPSFQFGCKRMMISSDYYPSLERENVDLLTSGIQEVKENCIVTKDGLEHPVDCIILATGFSLGLASSPFEIVGLEGRSLGDDWAKTGAVAYKGVAVSGYPNWFMIMGPNTGPGHTSVLIYTEAQIKYALQGIKRLMTDDLKYVDVNQQLQEGYNLSIQQRMKHTVWTSGSCKSWYLNDDGSNHALYPGFGAEYVARIKKFKPTEYTNVYFDRVELDELNEVVG